MKAETNMTEHKQIMSQTKQGLMRGARHCPSYLLEDGLVVIHVVHADDDLRRG